MELCRQPQVMLVYTLRRHEVFHEESRPIHLKYKPREEAWKVRHDVENDKNWRDIQFKKMSRKLSSKTAEENALPLIKDAGKWWNANK